MRFVRGKRAILTLITLTGKPCDTTMSRLSDLDRSFEASTASEIGLLEQTFVLMTDQMRLDLSRKIHHHDYNNQ